MEHRIRFFYFLIVDTQNFPLNLARECGMLVLAAVFICNIEGAAAKTPASQECCELCTDLSSLVQIIETENMMDRIVNGLSESSIKVRLAAVR